MLRELINNVPFSILTVVLMLMFVLISYLAAQFSSYFFPHQADKYLNNIANSLMSILTGGFFVLLAFIIINTWSFLQDARTAASKEADYLAIIVRNSAVFPEEAALKLKNAVAAYTVAVRVDEWVLMRHGFESPKAWNALENLYKTIEQIQPQNPKENIYYSAIINNMNGVLLSRRDRLNKIESLIPKSLEYSILVGTMIFAFMLGMVRTKSNFIGLIPVLLFSCLFGFYIALALSFDYPFSGDIAVSNKIFYDGVLGTFKDSAPAVSAPITPNLTAGEH